MKRKSEKTFIQQLTEIQDKFLKDAEGYGKVDLETFEVMICKGYLQLRVEGEDENEDTFAYVTEVESDRDCIYQSNLTRLNSWCEC